MSSKIRQNIDKEFTIRFKRATNTYYNVLMEEIKSKLDSVENTDRTYVILNYRPLILDVEGFKYTTLLYGYWNKEHKRFDDSIFLEQKVEKPFEKAKKEMKKLGFSLENVSDSSISKGLFIRLSWGDFKEKSKKVDFIKEKSKETFKLPEFILKDYPDSDSETKGGWGDREVEKDKKIKDIY